MKSSEQFNTKPLSQKDPKWEKDVLCSFRGNNYMASLVESKKYYENLSKRNDIDFTLKDRAVIAYTVAASAYGLMEKSDFAAGEEWQIFFCYLDKYVVLCSAAAKRDSLKGWFTTQPRTLLRECVELLCRLGDDNLRTELSKWIGAFVSIDTPAWGYNLALEVLLERIFHERMQFSRECHVENTSAMCEVYLEFSEHINKFRFQRAHVMNILSDLAYFHGGERGEECALEWVKKCLDINPDDKFAQMRCKFIEERLSVHLQIRRFEHDTNTSIAGITSNLGRILELPNAQVEPIKSYLRTMEAEINRLHGVNRFILKKQPEYELINPIEAAREVSTSFLKKAVFSFETSHAGKWDIDPDYFALALYNLFKNSVEAFERRKISFSERKISFFAGESSIIIEDNAGGVDTELGGRLFEPYVSSKGIRKETGLGLFQARQAINMLGGSLALSDKQPVGGARFEITF